MSAARGPKISVIVPVYNTEKYIGECLDSLMAQTLPEKDIEIIAVDDGSTDGSGAILDDYAKKHGRVRVIHRENGGSSAARNAGIAAARGEYLGFVDSDDTVSPGMYEALLESIERTGVKMAQTGRDEMAEDGSRLPDVVKLPEEECFILSDEMFFKLLLHEGDASFCTKLTARELFDEMGEDGEPLRFPENMLNEDFKLLIQMLKYTERLTSLPRRDYHVRYREGSNSRKERSREDYFPPVFRDIVVNADLAYEIVKRDRPGMLRAAKRFMLAQRLDYLLHIPVKLMNGANTFYRDVVFYIRKNRREIILNPYLSGKDRRDLLILSVVPRTVRALHKRIKRL